MDLGLSLIHVQPVYQKHRREASSWAKNITLCMNLTSCISFYPHSDLQSVFCHNMIALHEVLEKVSSHRTAFLLVFFCGKESCWPYFSKSLKRKTSGRRKEIFQAFLTIFPRLIPEEQSENKQINKRIPIIFITQLPFSKSAKGADLHAVVQALNPR